MEECCTTSDSSVSIEELYDAYKSWCSSNSEFQQYKRKSSLTSELGKKKYKVSYRGGRKSYLDGYELIVEEENPIFKPVEKREPVREMVLEEEEDDF